MNFPSREDIRDKLLFLIYDNGGTMTSADTYAPLADRLKVSAEAQRIIQDETYKNGRAEPVWNNMVQWARQDLVDEGYLDRYAPHGIWRLADKGVSQCQWLLKLRESLRTDLEQFRQKMRHRNEAEKAGDPASPSHS